MSTPDSFENVLSNRTEFASALGLDWDGVVTGRLTHGAEVSVVRRDHPAGGDLHESLVRRGREERELSFLSDAVASDVPGTAFFMTFADCVPLIYWDPERGVIAAVHAGWRGTALGIAAATVSVMTREFGTNPSDLRVAIGPSIGPCCYEVGADVRDAFAGNGRHACIREVDGAVHLDLWATNRLQLEACGVRPEAIDTMGMCTSCRVDEFFSHRREHGKTGRSGLLVALPPL
jgi:polyphenol oxidase